MLFNLTPSVPGTQAIAQQIPLDTTVRRHGLRTVMFGNDFHLLWQTRLHAIPSRAMRIVQARGFCLRPLPSGRGSGYAIHGVAPGF